jgi:hypothetical protein
MAPSVENLRVLAARMQRGDSLAWNEMQKELQPGLVHVLRRALRTGGESAVAQWLGRTLGFRPGPSTAAGTDPYELASLLCKEIACHLQSGAPRLTDPSAETVVEVGRFAHPCLT